MIKRYSFVFLIFLVLLVGCPHKQLNNPKDKFVSKYPSMPMLENAQSVLAGTYKGTVHMNMDPNGTPAPYYDKEFTLKVCTPQAPNNMILEASITPGNMPIPVEYKLEPTGFNHSTYGYMLSGRFDIVVDYSGGNTTGKTNEELEAIIEAQKFTLGAKSRIVKTKEGDFIMKLFYEDKNGIQGRLFFEGTKK